VPSRVRTQTIETDPGDGTVSVDREFNPTVFKWGFSVQYSLQYLQSFVRDVGLPVPLNRMIPLVEMALQTPIDGPRAGYTTGTIAPLHARAQSALGNARHDAIARLHILRLTHDRSIFHNRHGIAPLEYAQRRKSLQLRGIHPQSFATFQQELRCERLDAFLEFVQPLAVLRNAIHWRTERPAGRQCLESLALLPHPAQQTFRKGRRSPRQFRGNREQVRRQAVIRASSTPYSCA